MTTSNSTYLDASISAKHMRPLLVFFDVEFNNADRTQERVPNHLLELGAATIGRGPDGVMVYRLFNRLVKMPPELQPLDSIQALTGITPELLAAHGVSCEQALRDFSAFVGSTPTASWGNDLRVLLTQQTDFGVPAVIDNDMRRQFFNAKSVLKLLFGNSRPYNDLRDDASRQAGDLLLSLCTGTRPAQRVVSPGMLVRYSVPSALAGVRNAPHCALFDALRDALLFIKLMRIFDLGYDSAKLHNKHFRYDTARADLPEDDDQGPFNGQLRAWHEREVGD